VGGGGGGGGGGAAGGRPPPPAHASMSSLYTTAHFAFLCMNHHLLCNQSLHLSVTLPQHIVAAPPPQQQQTHTAAALSTRSTVDSSLLRLSVLPTHSLHVRTSHHLHARTSHHLHVRTSHHLHTCLCPLSRRTSHELQKFFMTSSPISSLLASTKLSITISCALPHRRL
jgi:hypothetical protein